MKPQTRALLFIGGCMLVVAILLVISITQSSCTPTTPDGGGESRRQEPGERLSETRTSDNRPAVLIYLSEPYDIVEPGTPGARTFYRSTPRPAHIVFGIPMSQENPLRVGIRAMEINNGEYCVDGGTIYKIGGPKIIVNPPPSDEPRKTATKKKR